MHQICRPLCTRSVQQAFFCSDAPLLASHITAMENTEVLEVRATY